MNEENKTESLLDGALTVKLRRIGDEEKTLLPIQYWLYEHHVPVINGRRIVNAPMKCCMRCKHTDKTHCVNEEDFIVCNVNGNCKHPNDWCLSFEKRRFYENRN